MGAAISFEEAVVARKKRERPLMRRFVLFAHLFGGRAGEACVTTGSDEHLRARQALHHRGTRTPVFFAAAPHAQRPAVFISGVRFGAPSCHDFSTLLGKWHCAHCAIHRACLVGRGAENRVFSDVQPAADGKRVDDLEMPPCPVASPAWRRHRMPAFKFVRIADLEDQRLPTIERPLAVAGDAPRGG